MKYELILFDADGTLFDFDRAEEYALESSMKHFSVNYDKGYHLKHYKEVNGAIWDEFERQLISAEKLKTERFRRYFERLELSLEPMEFSNRYLKHLSEASFLLEDAEELVLSLYDKYKLVIITNGLSVVQNNRLKTSPIAKYFDEFIISEEVGSAKPNTKIFEHTFEKINHKDKEKTIIVGDNLKSDILGGINFGIDSCWFNPKGKDNATDITPTYEISSLAELREILQ